MNKMLKLILTSVLMFSLAFPALAEGTRNTAATNGVTTNRVDNFDRDNRMFDMNGVNNRMDNRTTTDFRTNNFDNGNFRTTAADDNDMDWGWLGLLGLIGLAGLFNRNRETNR
jgi:hypothetical protein